MVSLKNWRLRVSLLFLFFSISAAILSPLTFNNSIPGVTDYFNHFAAIGQAKSAIMNGHLALRIASLEQNGWGYPFFLFYSPSSYLVAGTIARWITANPIETYKLTLILFMMIGAIYIYRLADWFVKSKPAALLGSIAYLSAPYYFLVLNRFGAFNEGIAIGILPATIFYSLQRFFNPNDKNLLQASICWYALATTHLLTFMWGSITCALILLILTVTNLRLWTNLIRTGFSYLFGLLLAAWTLGPIILFSSLLQAYHFADPTNTLAFQNSLSSLFSLGFNTAGPMSDFNMGNVHPAIGLPFMLGIFVFFFAFFNKKINLSQVEKNIFLSLGIVFLIIFIMIWSPYNFWKFLPQPLVLTQYSSRLIGSIMWIAAIFLSWSICWLFKNELNAKHVVIGIALIVTASSSWYTVSALNSLKYSDIADKIKTLSFNENTYMMKLWDYKDLSQIDSLSLDAILFHGKITLNKSYELGANLFPQKINSLLEIQGNVPDKFSKKVYVFLDNVNHGELNIKDGKFKKTISLPATAKPKSKSEKFSLTFATQPHLKKEKENNENIENINIEKAIIKGYLVDKHVMQTQKANEFCTRKNDILKCNIQTSDSVDLIELPQLFYPNMLEVKLNNKVVPYQSILAGDKLVVGISPDSSNKNEIQIKFTGLVWANYISEVSWGLWLLFLAYFLLDKRNKNFATKKS